MTITQAVADLLQQAGSAHHHAYSDTDGADPEWPLWYANYLQATLNDLLGRRLTQSEIVYYLVLLDKEYLAGTPANPWPAYYAEFLVGELVNSAV